MLPINLVTQRWNSGPSKRQECAHRGNRSGLSCHLLGYTSGSLHNHPQHLLQVLPATSFWSLGRGALSAPALEELGALADGWPLQEGRTCPLLFEHVPTRVWGKKAGCDSATFNKCLSRSMHVAVSLSLTHRRSTVLPTPQSHTERLRSVKLHLLWLQCFSYLSLSPSYHHYKKSPHTKQQQTIKSRAKMKKKSALLHSRTSYIQLNLQLTFDFLSHHLQPQPLTISLLTDLLHFHFRNKRVKSHRIIFFLRDVPMHQAKNPTGNVFCCLKCNTGLPTLVHDPVTMLPVSRGQQQVVTFTPMTQLCIIVVSNTM